MSPRRSWTAPRRAGARSACRARPIACPPSRCRRSRRTARWPPGRSAPGCLRGTKVLGGRRRVSIRRVRPPHPRRASQARCGCRGRYERPRPRGCLRRRRRGGGAARPAPARPRPPAQLQRGGTFRLGITGGGANDFIDGQHIVAKPDIARLVATFEPLSYFNEEYVPTVDGLAEEITAEAADVWTIRLRDGDRVPRRQDRDGGRPHLLDPANPEPRPRALRPGGLRRDRSATGSRRWTSARSGSTSSDLTRRSSTPSRSTSRASSRRATARTRSAREIPIGTGPFRVASFQPGQRSEHVRFENYWREGEPYFDEVQIIDFPTENGQDQRPPRGPARRGHRRAVRADSPDRRARRTSRSTSPRAAAGRRSPCASTRSPSRTYACARPSA